MLFFLKIKNIRRHTVLALLLATLSSGVWAAELPGGGGKLDYGIDDLPVPDPIVINGVTPRAGELLSAAASAEKTPFVRMQLLAELGESRLPQGVLTLISALNDPNPGIRATAARAIAKAGADDQRSAAARKALLANSQVVARLKAMQSDENPQVASAALAALISLQGPGSPAIEAALKTSVPEVLAAALEAASRPEHAKVIAGRSEDLPVNLRPRAILALGRCGDASQSALLISRAKGSDVQQIVAACQALAMLKSADAAPTLERMLESGHPTVRREAMRAFGQCSRDRRIEVATVRLADADPTVRQAAVEVIGANLRPDAVASLIPQLPTEYEPLYLATRAALINAKDDPTRESCIQAAGRLLNDASPRRQEDGSYVLGQYRSAHLIERHIQLLDFSGEQPDWKLITQAAKSTGRIGQQEPRAALVLLVRSRDKLYKADVKAGPAVNAAIVAAGQLGAAEILPNCDRILAEDPMMSDMSARMAAAFAIGVAGDAQSPGVNRLFSALSSPLDGSKYEAVKAIGNLKLSGAEARIKVFPGSDSFPGRWLIQWATARITGQPADYSPATSVWTARASILDATPTE